MKQNSLKSNFIFTFLYKMTMLLFPLVTFPYVSRVLGPIGIGQVNFAKSMVQYFIMIATLGIPIYGIREIAKRRDDLELLKKTFTQLICLSSLFALFSGIIYFSLIMGIDRFEQSYDIFALFGINIFFSVYAIDWFFNGMEAFRKVALRSIVVKVLSLIFLFLVIKSESDTALYAFVFVLLYTGDSILNFIMSRKYLDFNFSFFDIIKHLKPVLIFSFLSVAATIYQNLDSVMLGFLDSDRSVGLYNSAIKINRIIIVLVTTVTTVLIPRLSYYVEQNMETDFVETLKKSVSVILFVAIPSCAGLMILSQEIIVLFSGEDFQSASDTMKVLTFLIPIVGISHMLSLQILVPLNEEQLVLKSYLIGAVINTVLNIILIPSFSHLGAAIATVISEFSLGFILFLIVSIKKKIKIIRFSHLLYPIISLGFIPIIYALRRVSDNSFLLVIISALLCSTSYFFLLYIFRERTSRYLGQIIKDKLSSYFVS